MPEIVHGRPLGGHLRCRRHHQACSVPQGRSVNLNRLYVRFVFTPEASGHEAESDPVPSSATRDISKQRAKDDCRTELGAKTGHKARTRACRRFPGGDRRGLKLPTLPSPPTGPACSGAFRSLEERTAAFPLDPSPPPLRIPHQVVPLLTWKPSPCLACSLAHSLILPHCQGSSDFPRGSLLSRVPQAAAAGSGMAQTRAVLSEGTEITRARSQEGGDGATLDDAGVRRSAVDDGEREH